MDELREEPYSLDQWNDIHAPQASPRIALRELLRSDVIRRMVDSYCGVGKTYTGNGLQDWTFAADRLREYDAKHDRLLVSFSEVPLCELGRALREVVKTKLVVDPATHKITGQILPRLTNGNG